MSAARFIVADVFDGLAHLRDEGTQVDLVMTSPPFLALRSYLPADHPQKAQEIGSEPTPADFLSTMLAVTEACADVLAPHGSICFELGDTYSGTGGAGGDWSDSPATTKARVNGGADLGPTRRVTTDGWPLPKSLTFMPQLFGASLAYGRNLLDPERTTDPWRVRNFVAWVRPNPPVGALGDKVRPATSYLTWACKSDRRWFDLDAVRTEVSDAEWKKAGQSSGESYQGGDGGYRHGRERQPNPAGAPPLDWWQISPGGYSGSHYAVFPAELCRIPIEASCPRRVCRECGTPSRRETVTQGYTHDNGSQRDGDRRGSWTGDEAKAWGANSAKGVKESGHVTANVETTGWTSCGCPGTDGIRLDGYHTGPGWRPGIVLDPFAGSGTTLLAATGRCRDAIGIDLDDRNADLARERLGMFLTVEHLSSEAVA